MRRVALTDIESAAVRSLGHIWTVNEHWVNLWPIGTYVVLRRKSGWVRNFVINPPEPESFLADLRREVPQIVVT